jgi:exodeoxyribonuclease V beta subunit
VLKEQRWGGLVIDKKVENRPEIKKEPFLYALQNYGVQSDIVAFESKSQEELEAINFGLAMHYMLEMMGSFSNESIEDAKSMMLNKYGLSLDDRILEDIVQRVQRVINDKQFLELTDGKHYKEKALNYKKELRYIDLLIECDDGSWKIIDYKSSKNNIEEHFKQVQTYIDAVRLITQNRVDGYLCYILADSVKIVKV